MAHVHNQSCDDGEAGGHFKQDPGCDPVPPNQIWPGDGPFSPNQAGIANERTTVSYFANDDAIAVVVHLKTDTAAPKIVCADLS